MATQPSELLGPGAWALYYYLRHDADASFQPMAGQLSFERCPWNKMATLCVAPVFSVNNKQINGIIHRLDEMLVIYNNAEE